MSMASFAHWNTYKWSAVSDRLCETVVRSFSIIDYSPTNTICRMKPNANVWQVQKEKISKIRIPITWHKTLKAITDFSLQSADEFYSIDVLFCCLFFFIFVHLFGCACLLNLSERPLECFCADMSKYALIWVSLTRCARSNDIVALFTQMCWTKKINGQVNALEMIFWYKTKKR